MYWFRLRSSVEPFAVSAFTRPLSWLGPASSGAHPRTKGARSFHRWAPVSNTANPEGSPDASTPMAGKASGDPSQRAGLLLIEGIRGA